MHRCLDPVEWQLPGEHRRYRWHSLDHVSIHEEEGFLVLDLS
jgi:hypothetical protein